MENLDVALTRLTCAWKLLVNVRGKDTETAAAMRRAAMRYLRGAFEAFAEWVRTAIHEGRAGMTAVQRAGFNPPYTRHRPGESGNA